MKTIACLSSAGFGKIAVVAFAAASLALGASAATKSREVTALYSPGGAYVDTGIDSGAAQYAVELKGFITDLCKDRWIFGVDAGNLQTSILFGYGDHSRYSLVVPGLGLKDTSVLMWPPIACGYFEPHVFRYNMDGKTCFDDETVFEGYRPANSAAKGLNFFLFGMNYRGAVYGNNYPTYIFSCKIWEVTDEATHARTLVRDFTPCVDTDGVPGFYDAVSGDIFYSATAVPLIAAEMGSPRQFVESTGQSTQFVQPGLSFADKKYGVDITYAMTQTGSGDDWAFGYYSGNKSLMVGLRQIWPTAGELIVSPTNTATYYTSVILPTGSGPYVAQTGPFDTVFHHLAYNIDNKTVFDGVTLYEGTMTYASNGYVPMIFGLYSGGAGYLRAVRIAGLKVVDEDGTLLRDFVPATDPQGNAGLYENVEGWMYYARPMLTAGPVLNSYYAEVKSDHGTVSPASGRYSDAEIAENSLVLSAEEYSYENGLMYQCTGCSVCSSADGTTWSEPEFHPGLSYTYTKGVASEQVTWQWQVVGYRLTASSGPGAIAISTEPRGRDGDGVPYFAAGTAVALEAIGENFASWYGDGFSDRNASQTTLAMPAESTVITAYFVAPWLYDAGEGQMSDGYWTHSIDRANGGFAIGSSSSVPKSGMADYRKPIVDADGNTYQLTGINAQAFVQNVDLEELRLPETLESIGMMAFFNCSNLRTVDPFLPTDVTYLGYAAFCGCANLESPLRIGFGDEDVEMDKSGQAADQFAQCKKIPSAELGPHVKKLVGGNFYECFAMTNVVLSKELGWIGQQTFAYCRSLQYIDLSPNVTNIGFEAFLYTEAAETLRVGFNKNVEMSYLPAGKDQFCRMTALKKAELGPAIRTVPQGWFYTSNQLGEFLTYATEFGSYCVCVESGTMSALTNITFRSEVPPTYADNSFKKGFVDYQVKVFVPQGNAAWNAWITANVTPWNELGDLQTEYTSRYGETGKKPIGLTKDSAVPAKQWLFYEPSLGTMVLVR